MGVSSAAAGKEGNRVALGLKDRSTSIRVVSSHRVSLKSRASITTRYLPPRLVARLTPLCTSGTLLNRLRGHDDSVYSVAFTPDGKGLVSGSLHNTLNSLDLSGSKDCGVQFWDKNGRAYLVSSVFS